MITPEIPEYKPTDLVKALKMKPRESSIVFKGKEGSSIRFILPIRKFSFDDYLSFFAVGVFTLFISWLVYTTILVWGIGGYIFAAIVVAGLVYFYLYESRFFKEQQVIEIGRDGLKLERYLKKGNEVVFIPMSDIRKLNASSSSPILTYYDAAANEVKERMFMEYCQRSEKDWIVLILRSVIFNVTNRVV